MGWGVGHSNMLAAALVNLGSRLALALALVAAACAVGVAARRRVQFPVGSRVLAILGMLLLAAAAGGMTWLWSDKRSVVVMVDLSPSTRTAQYRDAASLQRRVQQLLGGAPHRVIYFAADNRDQVPVGDRLQDLHAERTIFNPPDAAAVLLFSDAQFEPPAAAPPMFIAVDPLLEEPEDAAVRRLEANDGRLMVGASNTTGKPRECLSEPAGLQKAIAQGQYVVAATIPAATGDIAVRLKSEDAWPENDRLAIRSAPLALSERWWIGVNPANGTWRRLDPSQLPLDEVAYLAPGVIVLDNVSAAALSETQQARLEQYVRDLGGALVIVGGDRAFAAGEYAGSRLEAMSPLASNPPMPTMHWILLADASGSMAAPEAATTRWVLARQSILRLLPHLPPEDPVTIGNFAERVTWWSQGRSARDTRAMKLPPQHIEPQGPTNLEPALLGIISSTEGDMPSQLLVMTDAETEFAQVPAINAGLRTKRIALNVLSIGRGGGKGLAALESLVAGSGGTMVTESSPEKWPAAMQKLFQTVSPNRLGETPVISRFAGPLSSLPARELRIWNHTWLKKDVLLLADGVTAGVSWPLAARWRVGAGSVGAVAFSANEGEALAMANLVAQPPRDPRFSVSWDAADSLRVTVDAVDGGTLINAASIQLELVDEERAEMLTIPQAGPGLYEVERPAPRKPTIATVRHQGRLLDRQAIAGRYEPEFNRIGNDRYAMAELARGTGGAVIPPNQTGSIRFNWPAREVPLASWLSIGGAMLIAAALVRWRIG